MFAVFDNNRPAKYPEVKVHPSWNNNVFATFEEAVKYANHWLGPYGGYKFELNVPIDYGYGSLIEIREIEDA